MVASLEGYKECPRCNRVLPRKVFGLRSSGFIRSYCPDCKRDYSQSWERSHPGRKSSDWDTSIPGPAKADGRPCPTCGEIFYPTKANLNRGWGKYCSLECAFNDRGGDSSPTICEQCGQEFEAKNVELNRGAARFCSPECWYNHNTGENHHLFVGGSDYRGADWGRQREEARRRDGFVCAVCGKPEMLEIMDYGHGLHVHHIVPYRETQDNSLDNLLTVCSSCHKRIEPTP